MCHQRHCLAETKIQKSTTHPTNHTRHVLKGMPCEEKIRFITILMVQKIWFLYVSTHDMYISEIGGSSLDNFVHRTPNVYDAYAPDSSSV